MERLNKDKAIGVVRKRTLTIDVTDDIQRILDRFELLATELKGEAYWKSLDKSYLQKVIYARIDRWYENINKSTMGDAVEEEFMNTILHSM